MALHTLTWFVESPPEDVNGGIHDSQRADWLLADDVFRKR